MILLGEFHNCGLSLKKATSFPPVRERRDANAKARLPVLAVEFNQGLAIAQRAGVCLPR
jgi:hypothetical protein